MKVFYRPEQTARNISTFSPSAEKPEQVVRDWLARGLIQESDVLGFEPVTREDLKRAHDAAFVDGVLDLSIDNGFGNRNAQVAASLPYTSGSLLAAARHALQHRQNVCSPTSGFHHAGYDSAQGFCTFNGLMVTALALLEEGVVRSIGVLDCDAHYGNGTDDIAKQLSVQGIRHHTMGAHFHRRGDASSFELWLDRAIEDCRDVDLLIYQAGADPHVNDPLGGVLTGVQMAKRDHAVFSAFQGRPLVWNLAGGWSIMDFVFPGYLGDAKSFEKQFLNNADSAAQLEPLISPLMLRRRVAEVAQDLPPRIDIPQLLDLAESEAAVYDAERERIYAEYGSAATLVALTSLRRFCAHPSLMGGDVDTADPMTFTKFRRLDEIVEEIFERDEKVLVFTSFTAMADIIARHVMKRFGAFAGVIDGRLPIEERQPMIDRFGSINGGAALVLNPKAGGAGLNIVAANHVIHYNPEWNPALEDQASARAHRRGQELPVTVHRLLIADTVEDVVNDRLTRKRTLSNAAIVGIEGKDEDYGDIVAALSRSPSKQERK